MSQTAPLYDTLGRGYRRHRRPDPRIAAALVEALGDRAPVLNVEEIERLRADLESGEWSRRNGALLDRETLDLGYRLMVFDLA